MIARGAAKRLLLAALAGALVTGTGMSIELILDDPNWRGRTSVRDTISIVALLSAYAFPVLLAIAAAVRKLAVAGVNGWAAGAALGLALYALLLGTWLGERFDSPFELLPGLLGGAVAGMIARGRAARMKANG